MLRQVETKPRFKLNLNKEVWNKLFKKYKDLKDGAHHDSIKIHCHLPQCIGYDKKLEDQFVAFDQLEADLTEIKNKGYNYTIYLIPQDIEEEEKNVDSWYKDFNHWQELNPDSHLAHIPPENIVKFSDYQKSANWQVACEKYKQLLQDEAVNNNETAKRLIVECAETFNKTHATQNLSLEKSQQHVIADAIFYLSLHQLQQYDISNQQDLAPFLGDLLYQTSHSIKVNVLMYTGSLSKIMNHLHQKCIKLDYEPYSFFSVQQKYYKTLEKKPVKEEEFVSREPMVIESREKKEKEKEKEKEQEQEFYERDPRQPIPMEGVVTFDYEPCFSNLGAELKDCVVVNLVEVTARRPDLAGAAALMLMHIEMFGKNLASLPQSFEQRKSPPSPRRNTFADQPKVTGLPFSTFAVTSGAGGRSRSNSNASSQTLSTSPTSPPLSTSPRLATKQQM